MTKFADDFLWGVASSAYQIEGASSPEERGASVWDAFCLREDKIREGHTGYRGCEHVKHYQDDVSLIADSGARAYRFSVSWPRVLPDGRGEINEPGLAFYDQLVDALLEKNVEPWITLFHWDFPLKLYQLGGWLNRDSAQWFADYAEIVVDRLSDRVDKWITLNEPQIFLGLGHYQGKHAPGVYFSRSELLLATHHALLAHGLSVQAIRAVAKKTPTIGWSPVGWVSYPATNDEKDIEEARQQMFAINIDRKREWPLNNCWYSDAVVLGHYPEQGLEAFGEDVPEILSGDMETIAQPIDFYGVNIYHGNPVTFPINCDGKLMPPRNRTPGHPETLMGWSVDPEALYWGPKFLYERYNLPIYITENGIAGMDWVHADGEVHDPQRIDYLTRHLTQLNKAAEEGVDIRGYFQWSIMDNFEWELGYSKRFGLTYVDYETMQRIPKDSYRWYQEVIKSNGDCLPTECQRLR